MQGQVVRQEVGRASRMGTGARLQEVWEMQVHEAGGVERSGSGWLLFAVE